MTTIELIFFIVALASMVGVALHFLDFIKIPEEVIVVLVVIFVIGNIIFSGDDGCAGTGMTYHC